MGKQLIIRLKTILHCKYLYVALILIGLIYIYLMTNLDNSESIYNINSNSFIMIISDYNIDGNKLSLTLDGKEKLIGNYYVNTLEELNSLKDEIKYGIKVKVSGELALPINNTIPNAFNYKEYLNSKNIYYVLNIESIEFLDSDISFIYKIKNIISNRIDELDSQGYMRAFILGDKRNIDDKIYENYQKIGVTHLFAISGMHVGLLSGILLKILKKLNKNLKYIIVDSFLVLYGLLVGFPASIKRCILFFIVNSLNKIFDLKLSTMQSFIITIFLIIISDYKIIYDVGFRFSAVTVLGIIISAGFIKDDNKFKASFKLSFVAFLFSFPITLSSFYEVNFLSVLYNMFYVPLVSIFIYPLALISYIFPFLSFLFEFGINLLEYITGILTEIRLFSLYLDFNMFEVILFYLILILCFFYRKYRCLLMLILIVVVDFFIPYFDSNGYVYFFDVGQGDSCLVISPYRKDVVMIDTGGAVSYTKEEWMKKSEYNVSDNVISFLKSKGIREIDLMILSHGDADHANEVFNINKEIKIKNIKINPGSLNELEKRIVEQIESFSFTPSGMQLSFLNYKVYNDENADSLLTYMQIYNTKIISFGDATHESEEDIIKKYDLRNVDIAKISHHGSKTSSSELYIKTIMPKIAVISSGRNNRFNHPNRETIDTLNKYNINYFNTQNSGTIEFVITDKDVTYNEYKP